VNFPTATSRSTCTSSRVVADAVRPVRSLWPGRLQCGVLVPRVLRALRRRVATTLPGGRTTAAAFGTAPSTASTSGLQMTSGIQDQQIRRGSMALPVRRSSETALAERMDPAGEQDELHRRTDQLLEGVWSGPGNGVWSPLVAGVTRHDTPNPQGRDGAAPSRGGQIRLALWRGAANLVRRLGGLRSRLDSPRPSRQ
jgi:hypothetical protein